MNKQIDILDVIKEIEEYNETFEEIVQLIFIDPIRSKKMNEKDKNKVQKNFLRYKNRAIFSIKNNIKMEYIDAIIICIILLKKCNLSVDICKILNTFLDKYDISKDVFINSKNREVFISLNELEKLLK